MKIIIVIAALVILSYVFRDVSDSLPCTHEIDWFPEHLSPEEGDVSEWIYFLKNDDRLNARFYFGQMNSEHNPHILLRLTNKSKEEMTLDNVRLSFLVEGKVVRIRGVGAHLPKACKYPSCENTTFDQKNVDIVLPPGKVESMYYALDYSISDKPEVGEVSVEFSVKSEAGVITSIVEEVYTLKKYSKRYNCVFGSGHSYQEVN